MITISHVSFSIICQQQQFIWYKVVHIYAGCLNSYQLLEVGVKIENWKRYDLGANQAAGEDNEGNHKGNSN